VQVSCRKLRVHNSCTSSKWWPDTQMNQLILCLCKHSAFGWEPMRCRRGCPLSKCTHACTHAHTGRVDLSCVNLVRCPLRHTYNSQPNEWSASYAIANCSSAEHTVLSSATCKVDTRSPTQVTSHQLPQVVAGRLVPEPVTQPARLVSNQNGLIICSHALICYPSKVPAPKQPPSATGMLVVCCLACSAAV